MEHSVFNQYDLVVLLIVITSSLLSLVRGFIREVFSLVAWIGAGIITFIYFPKVAALLSGYFDNKIVVSASAILGLYLVTLIIISVISALLLDFSRKVRLGAIDRTLGLAFGFARGLIIASLMHFAIMLAQGENNTPTWMAESRTYNLTGFGAGLLKDLYEDYIHGIHGPAAFADNLNEKLGSRFAETLKDDKNFSSSDEKELLRKVLKALPKKDKEDLAKKLDGLGEHPDEADVSETTLQALVLYKKAAEASMIKKDAKLSEDEEPKLDEAIKNLKKKVVKDDSEATPKDKELEDILEKKHINLPGSVK